MAKVAGQVRCSRPGTSRIDRLMASTASNETAQGERMAGNQQQAEQGMLPGLAHDGAEDAGLGRPLDAGMAGVEEVSRGRAQEAIDDAPQARTAASPLLHRLTICAR
eukprot:CAMPEP_0177550354 /NCGR_PEP_ID=MMETSP0369-20130122/65527_1 /TAXON_ID=447022 ORGANISM="Scrippsiella hangoei-like, Strain SHHI-4" /NCGR_SAMPLE_ID=MMETSP0369 /ASSEMBLY_ACC=CAM_ASM_000364 /LENGTH=106 /DNA_ID=CAMNT_0019035549 /DNA_START=183 /DNA_END=504 /DNA_ORIENTATION=-